MADSIAEGDAGADGTFPLAPDGEDGFSPSEGAVERVCRWACSFLIALEMALIGAELVARSVFNTSLQVTTELGGYILVAITFLSMSTCQARHAYHHFRLFDEWLGPRSRAILRLSFDIIAFGAVAILVWEFAAFEMASWRSGEVAPTNLTTPLWLPRVTMLIGVAALALTLARTIAGDVRRLRAVGEAAGGAPPR